MKYSVVVCAYNEEKQIVNCIRSLEKQIFDKDIFEVIVMNNQSSDNTKKVVESYMNDLKSNFNLKMITIAHVSLSSSRNTAIDYAKGEIICYVDADSIISKDWLVNIDICFNNNINTIIMGGVVENLNEKNIISDLIYKLQVESNYSNPNYNSITGANMSFKKEFFNNNNLFIDGFTRGDESSIVAKYFSNNKTNDVMTFCKNAVVKNDYPIKILEWLRNAFIESSMEYKIDKFIKFNNQKIRMKLIGSILTLISFLLIISGLINIEYLYTGLLLLLIRQIGSHSFYKKSLMFIIKTKYSKYSLFLIVYSIIMISVRDIGFCKGYFTFRNISFELNKGKVLEIKEAKV